MAEKRVDPEDGQAYTRSELAQYYSSKYTKAQVAHYWENDCKPVKPPKGKGKGKGKAAKAAPEPKSKAKAKAKGKGKAKAEPKPKAKGKAKAKAEPKAKGKAKAKAKVKAKVKAAKKRDITIGYHRIRGLAAALRMMCYYAGQNFTDVSYGNDFKETWFGDEGEKKKLIEKNACINLPYVLDGKQVITQSNTCLVHLGKTLNIDKEATSIRNHMVLDQVMDLRNDLMKIVYPMAGVVTDKSQFAEGAKKHMEGAITHFKKLNDFCRGPYMSGNSPESGDFHVFEMIDQHRNICEKHGLPDPTEDCVKLRALHLAFKNNKRLGNYFESDFYNNYYHNNGLFTFHSGLADGAEYGPSVTTKVEVKPPRKKPEKEGEKKDGEDKPAEEKKD